MHGCDERTWLVFNGEIYNHAELRTDLEKRGHKYASRTDSETILHLYEERGLDFIHDIEGDYGIALWDANKEQLVLVRDRIGVKPLYFYHQGGRFIFASEIKAILQHPAVTPDIDEQALYHYLTFLTTPAPTTLFRDIHKLPAGHMLTLKRDGRLVDVDFDRARRLVEQSCEGILSRTLADGPILPDPRPSFSDLAAPLLPNFNIAPVS